MKRKRILIAAVLACVLISGLGTAVFATNMNHSSAIPTNNNAGGIAGYVPPAGEGENTSAQSNPIANLYNGNGTVENESMLIIPIMTMMEEDGGSLLFTALLAGVVLGIVGTLAVQRIRRGKEK